MRLLEVGCHPVMVGPKGIMFYGKCSSSYKGQQTITSWIAKNGYCFKLLLLCLIQGNSSIDINKHYIYYWNKENLKIFSSANSIHVPTYSTIFPISLICSLFPRKLTHSKPWKTYKGEFLKRKFPYRSGQMIKVPSISDFQRAPHYMGIKLLLRNKQCSCCPVNPIWTPECERFPWHSGQR